MTNGLVVTVSLFVSGAVFSLANIWVGCVVFALGFVMMLLCMYADHLKRNDGL